MGTGAVDIAAMDTAPMDIAAMDIAAMDIAAMELTRWSGCGNVGRGRGCGWGKGEREGCCGLRKGVLGEGGETLKGGFYFR